jgi:hydroxyethylthiazole kinase-like uncharacterized protein yjeF
MVRSFPIVLPSMRILTSAQIRRIDQLSTEDFNIPGLLLMENAGMRVVEAIESRIEGFEGQSFVILCGKGNNGGDGFVVARQLIQRRIFPSVYLFASGASSPASPASPASSSSPASPASSSSPASLASSSSPASDIVTGDARTNLDILTSIGYPPTVIASYAEWKSEISKSHAGAGVDVVVDALLGTGLSRPAEGLLGQVIASIGDDFAAATIVSVDVPSGCAPDSADIDGPAVEADITVTLTALKHSLVFPPACHLAGEVVVADIGNPPELVDQAEDETQLLEPDTFPDALFPRALETNKGDYGKVLVIGGSRGKSGAAAMAAQAALQSGAGLVTVAVPECVGAIVAGHMPELMTAALGETPDGTLAPDALDSAQLSGLLRGKSVVALGPGIGDNEDTLASVRKLVPSIQTPLVLDADGINAFAGYGAELTGVGRTVENPIIITPHPGEMARLTGEETSIIVRNRLSVARDFAHDHNIYVVLKGFRTIIACPDGRAFVNPTGNPGMATAGSGDILTGMLAGIIGQPNLGTLEERLCLAVYLHGLAGDMGVDDAGEESLIATDILAFLPEAWSALRKD